MRKPPELVVTLAPLLVIVLVLAGVGVAFGVSGGSGRKAPATEASPTATATSSGTASTAATPVIGDPVQDDISVPRKLRRQLEAQGRTQPAFSFQIATFNVLGHSHTAPGGKAARLADSRTRLGWALQLLGDASADIVGFQEFQGPQYAAWRARTGADWDSYPGTALGRLDVDNTLAWDTSMFRAIEKRSIPIPYFGGHPRNMPYVLLEHLATGQRIWVANFHNPARQGRASNEQHRRAATQKQIALANDLAASGHPVFFTGDMNAREEYCNPVVAGTTLKPASGSCSPAGRKPVDWIFGSDAVAFTGYRIVDGGLVDRASDHPLIHATATVPESRAPSRS